MIFKIENLKDAEDTIRSILIKSEIDAIFVVDELMAAKTIKIARQLNIEIPENLKVIGCGDGELSREFYPSISSVDFHAENIGKIAVTNLINRIKSKSQIDFKSTVVESSLIQRNSSFASD